MLNFSFKNVKEKIKYKIFFYNKKILYLKKQKNKNEKKITSVQKHLNYLKQNYSKKKNVLKKKKCLEKNKTKKSKLWNLKKKVANLLSAQTMKNQAFHTKKVLKKTKKIIYVLKKKLKKRQQQIMNYREKIWRLKNKLTTQKKQFYIKKQKIKNLSKGFYKKKTVFLFCAKKTNRWKPDPFGLEWKFWEKKNIKRFEKKKKNSQHIVLNKIYQACSTQWNKHKKNIYFEKKELKKNALTQKKLRWLHKNTPEWNKTIMLLYK